VNIRFICTYIYTGISATIKSYLKAFAVGFMRNIYRDLDDTTVLYLRYHTMLLEAQKRWVWFRCFDTQRRVSRIGTIMTIQFLMKIPAVVVMPRRYCYHMRTHSDSV
jgi:hypothetical protein